MARAAAAWRVCMDESGVRRDTLHVFALTAFAVAQPVYDLLGRNAEFFVAHRSSRGDILVLVLLLSVALPAALALVRAAAGLVSRRAGTLVHLLSVFACATVIVLPALNRWPALSGTWALAAAGGIGLAATAAYVASRTLRTVVSAVSPAAVFFPLLFLFGTPVARLIVPPENPRLGAVSGSLDTPIVMVVFDELSAVHLMDEDRQIDAQRFPNFAELAAGSYWFRNASAVSDYTVYGIPSILTGLYPPEEERVPTVGDYPNNLFTLLGSTHAFNVHESITTLCPVTLCADATGTVARERHALLLTDAGIVFLNTIVPRDHAGWLPSVSTGWTNFAPDPRLFEQGGWQSHAATVLQGDRAADFQGFLDRMSEVSTRSLSFIHVGLPHEPLSYLPSGRIYAPAAATGRVDAADDHWTDDPLGMTTTVQRFALQVQFVDRMLGLLVRRLKEIGRYDEALVVVLADHGASFTPGGFKRTLSDDNHAAIMSVPLFFKLPHQQDGVVVDRNVQTIDVVPAIADVIGIQLPWSPDGATPFDDAAPAPSDKVIVMTGTKERRVVDARAFEALLAPPPLMGLPAGPDDEFAVYRTGPFPELLGVDASSLLDVPGGAVGSVFLDQTAQLAAVDFASGLCPAYLTGSVNTAGDIDGPLDVAVVINGRVAATARAFLEDARRFRFEAMIPEGMLVDGANDAAVTVISTGAEGDVSLLALTGGMSADSAAVSVEWTESGDAVIHVDGGGRLPVVPDGVAGGTGRVLVQHGLATFSGWAFDTVERSIASRVVLLVDDEQVASSSHRVVRRDVVTALGDEAALESGFSFSVPTALLRRPRAAVTEVIAVMPRGVATLLRFDDESRRALLAALDDARHYTLVESDSGVELRDDDGAVEPVSESGITARIDRSSVEGDRLRVQGWAVDEGRRASPLELLIFAGDELLHAGGFWVRRADIAGHYGGGAAMSHSGFLFSIALSEVSRIGDRPVRFIGRFRDGSLKPLDFETPYRFEPHDDPNRLSP